VGKLNEGRRRLEDSYVARRLDHEQKKRGWSNAKLAQRMGRAGCAMDPSALSKIKAGKRKINVEELASFAQVLAVSVQDLLKPLELALSTEINEVLEELDERRHALMEASNAAAAAVQKVCLLVTQAGHLTPKMLQAAVRQETAMLHMIDVMLEAEAAIRGDDFDDYPDSTELFDTD